VIEDLSCINHPNTLVIVEDTFGYKERGIVLYDSIVSNIVGRLRIGVFNKWIMKGNFASSHICNGHVIIIPPPTTKTDYLAYIDLGHFSDLSHRYLFIKMGDCFGMSLCLATG
jgi:hypothetical protein